MHANDINEAERKNAKLMRVVIDYIKKDQNKIVDPTF